MIEIELASENNSGNDRNFESIFNNYRNIVVRTAHGILHNMTDAEDVAQDVFLQVYSSIDSFRNQSSLSTWIYRITVNKSLNFLRKNKKRLLNPDLETLANRYGIMAHEFDMNSADSPIIAEERKRMLHRAIDALPKNQKVAFILSKYNDLQNKEIAEIMKISLSAVESLVFRAKKNLQKSLMVYFDKSACTARN